VTAIEVVAQKLDALCQQTSNLPNRRRADADADADAPPNAIFTPRPVEPLASMGAGTNKLSPYLQVFVCPANPLHRCLHKPSPPAQQSKPRAHHPPAQLDVPSLRWEAARPKASGGRPGSQVQPGGKLGGGRSTRLAAAPAAAAPPRHAQMDIGEDDDWSPDELKQQLSVGPVTAAAGCRACKEPKPPAARRPGPHTPAQAMCMCTDVLVCVCACVCACARAGQPA
jgi:hypothetical protein